MILGSLSALDSATLEPDRVVVVGAGAVGVHLAVELARRGRQVILLEAGTRTLAGFSPESFSVVGRRHDGIRIGRSRALGGTTNLWGGQLVEFMPCDFDGRPWLRGSRWPVRYEELARHYPPTYEALGIEPTMQRDAAVWQGIGKETPTLDEGAEVFLTRWLKVPNVAQLFRKELEGNPRILLVLDTTVVGFRGEGSRLRGVVVHGAEGETRLVEGRDIVLGAGTIENVRLLLHAAHDSSWECPWRDNDTIGRYFQDHLGGRLAYIRPRDHKAFHDVFCTVVLNGHKFQPKVRLRNDVLEREERLNCQAMISFESSIRENLVFLKQFVKAAVYRRTVGSLTGFARNLFACSRHMIPLMWKFVVEHRILIPSGSRITLFLQSEVEPMRESRITIDPAHRDAHGLSKVVLDWRLSGRELGDILDFTRRVDRALQAAGLADLEIEPELAAGDPMFLERLRDTNHQAGGCVMGETSEDGVVDADLRVHGTDNLHVVGACIFRTASNANTTFTAMTFATRLAEHLAGQSSRRHHATG